MLKNERLLKIEEIVNLKRYVSLHELMDLLNSSESTIRADLVKLESDGKLVRLHGGAQALDSMINQEKTIDEKELINIDEKKKIAQFAASLIENDMLVYIDAGTTTSAMVEYIGDVNATFITNSPLLGKKLKRRGFKVFVTGGEIKLSTDAFIGAFALEIVNRLTFDLSFFGTNGVSITEGYTTPDYEEAAIKSCALLRSKRRYVIADSSKLDVVSSVKFAKFEEAKLITNEITNRKFNKENVKEVK